MVSENALDLLEQAVFMLAASSQSVQNRVGGAYVYRLIHLHERDLPPELWSRVEEIGRCLTTEPPVGDEGTVQATTSKMGADDAVKLAQEMVELYFAAARHEREQSERGR